MTHLFDEFSKSLDESVPRRQSLRLLGAALAGALFSPLGLGTAWGAGHDPCKAFCRCSNKKQQNACLAACRACNSNPTRLCGACGSYACTDFANDFYNCGTCGNICDKAFPYEQGACVGGVCKYTCVTGAVNCGGTCTPVLWDPANCGACGNVCGGATPYCNQGICVSVNCPGGQTLCNGTCRDLQNDNTFCGSSCDTAVVCDIYTFCEGGVCVPVY